MLVKNIRRIRLSKGLSQEKLARLAKIALNTDVSLDELVKGKK